MQPYPFLCYPPYTAPRLNVACFGAMGVGVLGDAFLCYPPPPRLNAACFGAMGADVHLLCSPEHCAASISAAHLRPFYCNRSSVTVVPYGQPERCPGVAVLVDGALLTAVVSDAPYLQFEWAPLFFVPWALTLSSFYAASWRRCCHRPIDAERCRGSHLALFWHTDFDTN